MNKHLASLQEQRKQAHQAATRLIDTAEAAERTLSADEQRQFDEHIANIESLDLRIRDIQARDRAEAAAVEARSTEFGRAVMRTEQREAREVTHKAGAWLHYELEQRGLVGSGNTGGGAVTPAESAGYFFDRLAAESVALRSGIRVVRTDRDSLVIPRVVSDTTAAWTAEAGTITSTDASLNQVTATPKKLAGLQAMSNELIADSNPAILDLVGQGLIRSVALKFDLGVYEGSGTNPEIQGLKNVSGITTVSMGTNGAALTSLDPFADALGALAEANAHGGKAIVLHPRTWKSLSKLKEQPSGSNKPLLQESAGSGSQGLVASIYGVPVYVTSQLSTTETQGTSTDCSSAYVYDVEQVVAVLREDARVEVDRSRLFNSDQSELRVTARADLVVPNAAAVVRIVGIKP